MSASGLDKILNPKSIAVIGASDREGSVGYTLMRNLTELKYPGKVYAVNIRRSEILGLKAYQTVEQLPETVDLAIIATPAKAVPQIVEQCGEAGIKGIIIISAGFKEIGPDGIALEKRIIQMKKKYDQRIIGPNCLGVIRPSLRLNATFTTNLPKPGPIAFISQSGALGAVILDLAIRQNIGLSNFVSIGSMIDVDFGDLIEYFGTDSETRSILIYIEGLADARNFINAARHYAKTKPIIVAKSGRFSESARAASSHTGALAGEDLIYDAAFKRAGLVRVDEIADLFHSAEVLGMQPLPEGPNLAIITNAGGPGVMATDALIARYGKLAELSQETMEKLNSFLPPYWSRGNPIDILGDSRAARYKPVIEACLDDANVDGLIVIYTGQAMGDPVEIARSIVEIHQTKGHDKTILTSFMGHKTEEANKIFTRNQIPTFSTPEQAVKTYMYMYQYKRNLEMLYETAEELPADITSPKVPIITIMKNAAL
ncbi:MAG: CoA-binding protein, partial [Candidatus Bathyarchaeota archaeon]